jgi:hypothetical protein
MLLPSCAAAVLSSTQISPHSSSRIPLQLVNPLLSMTLMALLAWNMILTKMSQQLPSPTLRHLQHLLPLSDSGSVQHSASNARQPQVELALSATGRNCKTLRFGLRACRIVQLSKPPCASCWSRLSPTGGYGPTAGIVLKQHAAPSYAGSQHHCCIQSRPQPLASPSDAVIIMLWF